MKSRTRLKVTAGAAALALLLAACGDDDDTEEAAEDPNAAYCALAAELDEQEDFPSVEQLEALRDAAPEEISDEVDAVVEVFIEADEAGDITAAFEDPVAEENFPAIEAFEAEECGIGGEDGEDGEATDFVVAPEDEEFCAIATEIDSQDDFPTPEQLEAYRAAAPEEIADAANLVVDAFVEAGDDPFAAFEAPGVDEAFTESIEPFEAEHCGLHADDDEDGPDQDPSVTEPDESAAQVAVTATDYAFDIEPAPTAGRTQFTMTNAGEERHVMVLFRLAEGTTIEDALESEGEGTEEEYESDTAAAGEEAVLTVDLTAGEWGMICYLPTADGTPHFMEGMQTEFTIS